MITHPHPSLPCRFQARSARRPAALAGAARRPCLPIIGTACAFFTLAALQGCATATELDPEPLAEASGQTLLPPQPTEIAPDDRAEPLTERSTGPATASLANSRVYALPDRPTVIFLTPALEHDADGRVQRPGLWWPNQPPSVSVGGQPVTPETVWLGARANNDATPITWLDPGLVWRSRPLADILADTDPAERLARDSVGLWLMILTFEDLPETGTTLELEGDLADVRPLPQPPTRAPVQSLPPLTLTADQLVPLVDLLEPTWNDALTRWRVELLADRLPVLAQALQRRPSPPRDPYAELLAQQTLDHWRLALANLHEADPDVARRVIGRLIALIELPWNTRVPAWPRDPSGQRELLRVLLDPDTTPQRRAAGAEAWADTQPTVALWPVSDALPTPAVSFALADLTGLETRAAVAIDANPALQIDLPPHASAAFELPLGREVRSVTESASRSARAVPALAVRPPGLDIPALLAPATLESWLVGEPALNPGDRLAARVQRDAKNHTWEIYVESLAPEPVSLWIGPFGSPKEVLSLAPTRPPTSSIAATEHHELVLGRDQQTDRWAILVRLPPETAQPDGSIHLAITQPIAGVGPSIPPASWPRPMLPGQPEPGRVRLIPIQWETPNTTSR